MAAVLIDANLLVLLIVGLVSRDLIGRHRRLRQYSEEDFNLLRRLISGHSPILVTPNTLTEASNLCRQISGREHQRIAAMFRALLDGGMEEQYIDSRTAAKHEAFPALGLTDAAILEQMESRPVLITTDLDLFVAADRRGHVAINFNHMRPV
jgi:hypothetical protein